MNRDKTTMLFLPIVLGVVTAGITTNLMLRGRASSVADPVITLLGPSSPSDQELLDKLQRENADLRARVTALEMRPPSDSRTPLVAEVSHEDLDELRQELLASNKGSAPTPVKNEQFKAEVADALTAVRQEERLERMREEYEEKTANLGQRVSGWSKWLRFDEYQQVQMRALLMAQDERDRELLNLREDGAEEELIDDQRRSNWDVFLIDLEGFLSPEQLEQAMPKLQGRGSEE